MDNIEIRNETNIESKQENKAISFNIEGIIQQAVINNSSVETIEKLLAMRRELKAEWAKEQFEIAMAKFQGECPVIKKEKAGGKTNAGLTAYFYAPIDAIIDQTKNLIRNNGFSYDIQTETFETYVKVVCNVNHQSGHSKSSSIQVPLGAKTNLMSAPQVVASALTFAKRYAFCNAFGIITGDDDNDANIDIDDVKAKAETLTAKNFKELNEVKDRLNKENIKFTEFQKTYEKIQSVVTEKDKLGYAATVQLYQKGMISEQKLQERIDLIKNNYNQFFQGVKNEQ